MIVFVAILIIGAIVGAIIFFDDDEKVLTIIIGVLLGTLCGLVISMATTGIISKICSSLDSNYLTKESIYELTSYSIGDKDNNYYVYANNNKGDIQLSVQYFDDDGNPQKLLLDGTTEFLYDKSAKPSIKIMSKEYIDSPWVMDFFKETYEDEYVITIPNSNSILTKY